MVADMVGSKTVQSQWNETVSYYGSHTFLKYISVNDEVSCFTYHEFDLKVKQAANVFLALGIRKQELVALHLHNKPEYLICWLALAQIGAVRFPRSSSGKRDGASAGFIKGTSFRLCRRNRCHTIYFRYHKTSERRTLHPLQCHLWRSIPLCTNRHAHRRRLFNFHAMLSYGFSGNGRGSRYLRRCNSCYGRALQRTPVLASDL